MFYKQLHGLRGLASLMVFFAHITAGYNLHVNSVLGTHTTQGSLQYYITNIGTFGVEIFFFLSGFVILKSSIKENEKAFFTRRAFRIYPIFLLFSLLFIIGNIITNSNPELNNIKSILLALSFTNIFFDSSQLTPNAWSVVYEVWYYFGIYYIVSLLIKKESLKVIHLLAIAVMVWFVVTKPITIYFLLGALLGFNTNKVEKSLKAIKPSIISLITCASLFLISYLVAINTEFGSQGWLHSFSSKEFVLPIILLVILSLLLSNDNLFCKLLENKVLTSSGNISYTLYLLHPYSYRVCRHLIEKINIQNGILSFIIFIIITTFLTLTASFIVSKFFEMPIYKRYSKKEVYTS